MELIDQRTKAIMEGCKERAWEAGLRFAPETLEYIVTNRDLLELTPKHMIPTLYDYWVHDVEVHREKGRYELYPNNPYETVINTRPAISFYNDNNPDWLNVMIFYHVLAHIDFFQNNLHFQNTWGEDFAGKALSDKRAVAMLRSEKGRWVDYVIEFSRGIDNLVGYYKELGGNGAEDRSKPTRLDFYFDHFLQEVQPVPVHEYLREIERYNACLRQHGELADSFFFAEVLTRHPELDSLYEKHLQHHGAQPADLLDYLQRHSPFLQREENRWMKTVMEIVRTTSLFFQPQIRTKIMNEGWASYWHEKLFLADERISGHEVGFARIHALVTSMPKVGVNPYALGMRLFHYVEELADKGKLSLEYEQIASAHERQRYDARTGRGRETLLDVRRHYNDFLFLNKFIDQDFVDRHKLFVVGRRLNPRKGVWELFVQSRRAEDYKKMLLDSLYHPPVVEVDESLMDDGCLYLRHRFEGKPLVREFIGNTMLGISFLWGGPVKLETTEWIQDRSGSPSPYAMPSEQGREPVPRRVLYTMEDRRLSRTLL
ncbi:stage V sporulation protein R [Desulfacinum hydrothermale DSM 13146]|uniref:Stage V sporulation protein R n=1 Tax=Desulfacinum hydrothermale DSM 13146 TaxID=1121390 RepID=A0A1W1XCT9_9BACT|nr:SpoVR family protein [Desulfacinum hydrothermale]SMC21709.1 stage V sporulation protein R [Desulfacinum hydrothermale DSM 13146]